MQRGVSGASGASDDYDDIHTYIHTYIHTDPSFFDSETAFMQRGVSGASGGASDDYDDEFDEADAAWEEMYGSAQVEDDGYYDQGGNYGQQGVLCVCVAYYVCMCSVCVYYACMYLCMYVCM